MSSSSKSTPSAKDGKDKKSTKSRPKSKEVEEVLEGGVVAEVEAGPISLLGAAELSRILSLCDHFQLFRSMRVSKLWSSAARGLPLERFEVRSFYGGICDEHVNSVVNRYPQLHTVAIHASPRLTDKAIKSLAKLASLTALDLSNCRNLSDSALLKLPLPNAQKLVSLKVAHCSFSDRGLKLGVLHSLTALDISGCDCISDRLASHLVQYTPHLLSLNASGCPTLANDFLSGIAKLTSLTELNVRNCNAFDHNGFLAFADPANIPLLKNLRKLDFSTTNINNEALQRICDSCEKLEYFNLAFCHRVDDGGAQSLEKLQKLEYLSLAYTGITEKTLSSVEHIDTLRTIILAGCKALKKKIGNFTREHPNLHIVYKSTTTAAPTQQK